MRISAIVAACAACGFVAPVGAQTTTRVSVNSGGVPAAIAYSSGVGGVSSDGRYVVFGSDAPNLVSGDTNGQPDVFVHDRLTGITTRVSVSSSGAEANDWSGPCGISLDGRFVLLRSDATNLVSNDTNGVADAFLRDELLHATTRIDVSTAGAEANAQVEVGLCMTPDGAWIAFSSSANNLDPQKTTAVIAPFVRDVANGTTTALPLIAGGGQLDGAAFVRSMSSDARFILLDSYATNIVAGDANNASDVFVHDRILGATVRISVDSAGIGGDSDSRYGGVSDDGRFAVFGSLATNLVPGDTNGAIDVFLRDLQLGTTSRLSVDALGNQGNASSDFPSITPDGRFVAFFSTATNLVAGHPGFGGDQYRLDRQTGALAAVSVSTLGDFPPGPSWGTFTFMSDDGDVLAFSGTYAGIVPTQIYSNSAAFVHDFTVFAPVTTYCTAKINSLGCRPEISSAGVPRFSGVDAFFLVADDLLPNKFGVFFWSQVPNAAPFGGGTLCVKPPLIRTNVQSSGVSGAANCSGTYSFQFRQSYMQAHGLAPGDTIYGQFWSRDPGFAPPNNIGLTDAVRFGVIP